MIELSTLTHREKLGLWLNENGFLGSGAEIGVATGGLSAVILKDWKGAKYYMVDLWKKQDASVYKECQDEQSARGGDRNYDGWFRCCLDLQERDGRIVIIRDYSVNAATMVDDASLDFAYIDANHDYDPVMADINAWYPKVKPGGLICGHDYADTTQDGHWMKVKSAVNDWNKAMNLPLHLTACNSWWMLKPL